MWNNILNRIGWNERDKKLAFNEINENEKGRDYDKLWFKKRDQPVVKWLAHSENWSSFQNKKRNQLNLETIFNQNDNYFKNIQYLLIRYF